MRYALTPLFALAAAALVACSDQKPPADPSTGSMPAETPVTQPKAHAASDVTGATKSATDDSTASTPKTDLSKPDMAKPEAPTPTPGAMGAKTEPGAPTTGTNTGNGTTGNSAPGVKPGANDPSASPKNNLGAGGAGATPPTTPAPGAPGKSKTPTSTTR